MFKNAYLISFSCKLLVFYYTNIISLPTISNIQKIRDGEPLGGRSSATDDFSTEEDDDFLS